MSTTNGTGDLRDHAAPRRVVTSASRFDGRVWRVESDVVDLGDGQQVERDVLRHPGAVGVVAVDRDLNVLLIQQYRHPVATVLWEPPAGLLDIEGEEPLDAAARELYEEAGYRAGDWSVLVDAFTSPGGSDESVRIYLARELTEVGEHERHVGDGEERDMPVRWAPLRAVRDAILAGELHSPLGVMGFLAAASLLLDGAAATADSAVPRPADAPWFRGGVAGPQGR